MLGARYLNQGSSRHIMAPASPRALQTTAQTHVFSLNLKPNMFTWTAVATFMYTTMWAELAKLIHWCHLDEPQWCDGYYMISRLYKKLQINGHQKVLHGVISFLVFTYLFGTADYYRFLKWKPFCTLSTIILSVFGKVLHTHGPLILLWMCKYSNTSVSIRWIQVTVNQILCDLFYTGIILIFRGPKSKFALSDQNT